MSCLSPIQKSICEEMLFLHREIVGAEKNENLEPFIRGLINVLGWYGESWPKGVLMTALQFLDYFPGS